MKKLFPGYQHVPKEILPIVKNKMLDLFVILHLPTISSHVVRLSNTMMGVINLF